MLLYGGSRSGKSALLADCIFSRAWIADGSRHLIVRKEGTAAKRAIVRDTFPAVWSLRYPDTPMPEWKDQEGYYQFANGSQVWVGGLNDDKALEKLLGNEYATIWPNEASEVNYNAFTLLRSRLAQTVGSRAGGDLKQRMYVDLNPTNKMHWTYRLWVDGVDPVDQSPVDRSQYKYSVINPNDNRENLSGDYLADLAALPEKAKKRFFHGEYSADDDNALWRREWFKRLAPLANGRLPVELQRVVIAVDPAASDDVGADETGIIAAGVTADGRGVVLQDESGRYRPEQWAQKAIALYRQWNADVIVAEKNNGGDMVEAVIRAQASNVSYRGVHATRGKVTRAEPVAALYELGKVQHLARHDLGDLEDQLCAVTQNFDRKAQGWSPDRMDALVWALTELFPELEAQESFGDIPMPEVAVV